MKKTTVIPVQVRLPEESRRLLRVRAAEQGRSQSDLVHDLIMSGLSIVVPVKRKAASR